MRINNLDGFINNKNSRGGCHGLLLPVQKIDWFIFLLLACTRWEIMDNAL